MASNIKVFSATATQEIAWKVVKKLQEKFPGITLGNANYEKFKDSEITVDYGDSVRKKQVFIFGSTGTNHIMELCLMLDAAKRASAGEIFVVLPYYGYARQDKKEGKNKRGAIGAKLVADLLTVAAGNRFNGALVIDLHADAIEGFFDVGVTHLSGMTIFKSALSQIIATHPESYIIVSPDAGGKQRAKRFAKKLEVGLVGMDKTRLKPGEVADISLVGDVEGCDLILVDDMVDSGGTLIAASTYLINEKKAKSVQAVCTHGVLSLNAIDNIEKAEHLSKIYVSDTIVLSDKVKASSKIEVISSSDALADFMCRMSDGDSINEINN